MEVLAAVFNVVSRRSYGELGKTEDTEAKLLILRMEPDQSSDPDPQVHGKVVVLTGFPGTGKLTIATKMKSYFPEDTIRLIDNHLLIDPARAIYPGRSAAHCELRRKIRKVAFDTIRKIAQEGKTVLMTACLVDSKADIRTFEEHISIVRTTCIPIYWLNLGCDRDVLEKRVTSEERREWGKTKLTNASVLRQMVEDHKLLNPRPYDYEPAKLIAE
ncbi:hypothetical protein MKX08_008846 [Trichoderma sp. CBMAI-0020]|nr:hypothetical protein MKX08_008846 [Trichoderma sp. CBMAI-0020]